MKNTIIHSMLLLLALILLSSNVRGQEFHPIVGTWVFNGTNSYPKMIIEAKTRMDTIPNLRSKFYSDYDGRSMIFLPNGNFTQVMGSGIRLNGTWSVEGKTLVLRNEKGESFYQQIGELTSNSMILILPSNGESKPVLPELHFQKI